MKLWVLLLLLVSPAHAQLFLSNAASGNTNDFAPGSLVLVSSSSANLVRASLTIAPSTNVPVFDSIAPNLVLVRLPVDLPIGEASISAATSGKFNESKKFTVVPSSFGIFSGPLGLSPGDFSVGSGDYNKRGVHFAQKNNGPQVGLTQPAHPGDYLTIYGTGLGGAGPNEVSSSLAGLPIPVTYVGPAPGQPGVDQLNVFIPQDLAAPDSCNNSFSVEISATVATQSLSFTKNSPVCPSSLGFNAAELAAIDQGKQVAFLQISAQSGISPSDGAAGFTRYELAYASQRFFDQFSTQSNVVDSVFYSCGPPRASFFLLGIPQAISTPIDDQGLSLIMGQSSVPIQSGLIVPTSSGSVPALDALPPSIYQPGTWQLSGPNFTQPIRIVPPIELQNVALLQSIAASQDLTITWNPSGYTSSDAVWIVLSGPTPFACNARATAGSLTIPSSYLTPGNATLAATVSAHPDKTPNFRLPQSDGTTVPLQFTYSFSESLPITVRQ